VGSLATYLLVLGAVVAARRRRNGV